MNVVAGSILPPTAAGNVDATGRLSHPALVGFCAEHAVEWMQPYFARDVNFYVPFDLRNEVFGAADLGRTRRSCAANVSLLKPNVLSS